jgi:hypothetical protein
MDEPRDEELPPSEAARARRRDHDAAAHERAGMRSGLAKGFKQILDAQVRRARDARTHRTPDELAEGEGPERPAPKKGRWRRQGGG